MRFIEGVEAALAHLAGRGREGEDGSLTEAVRAIIGEVRRRGDSALRDLSERFDGVRPGSLAVEASEFDQAASSLQPELRQAVRLAVRRIEEFYRLQPAHGFLQQSAGSLLGQLVVPLQRVGCYVPGGTAPLFSTLLMTAVPARVAGVPEIVVATPPGRDGAVAPEILFAAREAGVGEVYRIGGAQAIAALAFGTESVGRVDKIVGPGNRFVVEAKRQVFGSVGIEALPGPTETLLIADRSASVAEVVADLLAQAEHAGAQPLLVSPERSLLEAVARELPRAAATLPTAATALASLEERGLLVLVGDLREALAVANAYAPEHLCLLVEDPFGLLSGVRNAGGVFLGHRSMEALGDYVMGPSHVMPTGGTARFSSSLNLRDFQKVIPVVRAGEELLQEAAAAAARMARAEGLEAHARAIELRTSGEGK